METACRYGLHLNETWRDVGKESVLVRVGVSVRVLRSMRISMRGASGNARAGSRIAIRVRIKVTVRFSPSNPHS